MALQLLVLAIGLGLLLVGGEVVVRGATGLARALGVSPLVIGLTVVAFGTSAPELAVNLIAALDGRTEICFGNIVGSNLANIGLIVGAVSTYRPMRAAGLVITREIPMMLLATATAIVLGLDQLLSGGVGRYDRGDGLTLLLLFLVFLYYTVGDFMKFARPDTEPDDARLLPLIGTTTLGLCALVGGAELAVGAASYLATQLGVPDVIIGITVLSIGTSLPELVASIIAARRGHVELAVGNIIGSNIFNLLLVFGATAVVEPIRVPVGGSLDLLALSLFSLTLFTASMCSGRRLIRVQSLALLIGYFGYVGWRAFGGAAG